VPRLETRRPIEAHELPEVERPDVVSGSGLVVADAHAVKLGGKLRGGLHADTSRV
jgi:hypothetical protein